MNWWKKKELTAEEKAEIKRLNAEIMQSEGADDDYVVVDESGAILPNQYDGKLDGSTSRFRKWNQQPYWNKGVDYSGGRSYTDWTSKPKEKQLTEFAYVEQMANALAGSFGITVKAGDSWGVDTVKREIKYPPFSLLKYSKARVLAELMHEIGQVKHAIPSDKLKFGNALANENVLNLTKVLTIFGDGLRTDYKTAGEYPSATNVIEAFSERIADISRKQHPVIDDMVRTLYGLDPAHGEKIEKDVQEAIKGQDDATIKKMWDVRAMYTRILEQVKNDTKEVLESKNTQDIIKVVEERWAPLLKDIADETRKLPYIYTLSTVGDAGNMQVSHTDSWGDKTMPDVRGENSGMTDDRTPEEWRRGEYEPLKASVRSETASLIRKLAFLKSDDNTIRYMPHQRRGIIDGKRIIDFALGKTRIFKRRMPTIDRVGSVAISLALDVSGSMFEGEGSKDSITSATRATILLAETCKSLGIPFEVITFGSTAKVLKDFEGDFTQKVASKLAGVPAKEDGGGTNLEEYFKKTQIRTAPKSKRVAIIMCDGGCSPEWIVRNCMPDIKSAGVKTLGVEIGGRDGGYSGMETICGAENTVRVSGNMGEMPNAIAGMLRRIILGK